MVSEGYLGALVRDLRDLPAYWEGMLKDFPGHPAKNNDPQLRASIGCTLYGYLDRNPVLIFSIWVFESGTEALVFLSLEKIAWETRRRNRLFERFMDVPLVEQRHFSSAIPFAKQPLANLHCASKSVCV